jgi:hypothetical protein
VVDDAVDVAERGGAQPDPLDLPDLAVDLDPVTHPVLVLDEHGDAGEHVADQLLGAEPDHDPDQPGASEDRLQPHPELGEHEQDRGDPDGRVDDPAHHPGDRVQPLEATAAEALGVADRPAFVSLLEAELDASFHPVAEAGDQPPNDPGRDEREHDDEHDPAERPSEEREPREQLAAGDVEHPAAQPVRLLRWPAHRIGRGLGDQRAHHLRLLLDGISHGLLGGSSLGPPPWRSRRCRPVRSDAMDNPALAFRPEPGSIPDVPGCYLFRDAHGRVVYVGKAKSLRSRLSSYFQGWSGIATRTRAMLEAARSVEWIVVDSEVEALHLEYTLIQRHRPRYNIRYRDDKSYPYLVLTTSQEVPRARVQRGAVARTTVGSALRPRVRDPRDARPAAARVPGADLLAGGVRPGSAQRPPLPAAPHRPVRRPVHRGDRRRRAPGARRGARELPRRGDRPGPPATRRADARRRERTSTSRRRRDVAISSRRPNGRSRSSRS